MSLQAHTEAPARELLPVPDRLYLQLVKVAARLAVPMDDLAEYIFLLPTSTVRDLEVAKAFERSTARAAAEREEAAIRGVAVACRGRGGRCPTPFTWRGTVRCGCA